MADLTQRIDAPPGSFSGDAYRHVMRHWPSGVTVITMLDGDLPHGMTASAFTSVSADPPLVLVVIDQRWRSHAYVKRSRVFCVSILRADQSSLSDRFAGRLGRLEDQFEGLPTAEAANGVLYLTEAAAFLACRVIGSYESGDHTIFVGQVIEGAVLSPDAEPLVFFNTQYRHLAAP